MSTAISMLGSSDHWYAVTPDSNNDMNPPPRALYIGTGGDVIAIDWHGNTVTFVGVPAGSILSVTPKRVLATTTASNIVAMV